MCTDSRGDCAGRVFFALVGGKRRRPRSSRRGGLEGRGGPGREQESKRRRREGGGRPAGDRCARHAEGASAALRRVARPREAARRRHHGERREDGDEGDARVGSRAEAQGPRDAGQLQQSHRGPADPAFDGRGHGAARRGDGSEREKRDPAPRVDRPAGDGDHNEHRLRASGKFRHDKGRGESQGGTDRKPSGGRRRRASGRRRILRLPEGTDEGEGRLVRFLAGGRFQADRTLEKRGRRVCLHAVGDEDGDVAIRKASRSQRGVRRGGRLALRDKPGGSGSRQSPPPGRPGEEAPCTT